MRVIKVAIIAEQITQPAYADYIFLLQSPDFISPINLQAKEFCLFKYATFKIV